MSLGKLGPGQQAYYVDSVARGLEEYYTGAKEAPGPWLGTTAARLGLTGEVDPEHLARVLANEHPTEGWRLTSSKSVPVVAGYDVTFCAPKSVSLLFALGDPEVSNEVRNAADAAIAASLPVLEREACRVRRGKNGHTVLDGDGFVAAAFRHRTSRAGDPHLHTHVVLANVARAEADGRWTALDGRPLYAWLSPVGHLYEAQLRWELTRRLGVGWQPVRNGIADVAGIDRTVIREFSTRRKEIEVHLEEYGHTSARAAQFAAYATRRAKDPTLDANSTAPEWRARAEALGLDDVALHAVTGRDVSLEPPAPRSRAAERIYRWLASPDGLTAAASTFGRREVIKAICNALPAGAPVEHVLDLAEEFLTSRHVLGVATNRGAATIRRTDGTVVAAHTDDTRYTTPDMLEVEARLVDTALRVRGAGRGVAHPEAVDVAVAGRELSEEQDQMVRAICSSGDGVDLVEGVAGAGKTYALAAARHAWEASGRQVLGCSLAARAAKHLQRDAGIPSSTLDGLLARLDRGRQTVDGNTVVVVDESAMVGTRKLARLLTHADSAGAKVVLVGDPCQLPEIEAGGAFRGLRDRLDATVLLDNRRQTETWERGALAELRAGDVDRAVDAYLDHDRVHVATSASDARDSLVNEWMNARAEGEDVLMVAGRLADVDDLNRRARAVLHDEGYLGLDRVVLARRRFAEGDDVLALRNDYRLGILNGTRGLVQRIDLHRRSMTLTTDDGDRLAIPFAYAEAGNLTHGYATTVHKAQGLTVDRCYVLADDTTSREHAYTALSRGRHGNDLFTVEVDRRHDERHAPEIEPDTLERLRASISRSAGQYLAIDGDQGQRPRTRLDELRRERKTLHQQLGGGPPDPSRENRRLVEQRRWEQTAREGAERRRDNARHELDRLGPIRRVTRPADRRELEGRLARFEAEIDGHDAKLVDLDRQLDDLAPTMLARHDWERDHRPELDRLAMLDRHIELEHGFQRVAERAIERTLDRGHGIER
ncbi:MAG: MobF family relaxase [Acidimicrobiia bacterium]